MFIIQLASTKKKNTEICQMYLCFVVASFYMLLTLQVNFEIPYLAIPKGIGIYVARRIPPPKNRATWGAHHCTRQHAGGGHQNEGRVMGLEANLSCWKQPVWKICIVRFWYVESYAYSHLWILTINIYKSIFVPLFCCWIAMGFFFSANIQVEISL